MVALAAVFREIEVIAGEPAASLNTSPPEKTGPSTFTACEGPATPVELKMTLFEVPGRPWMTFEPAKSEVKLLPLALKPNQLLFTPPFQ